MPVHSQLMRKVAFSWRKSRLASCFGSTAIGEPLQRSGDTSEGLKAILIVFCWQDQEHVREGLLQLAAD
jgi:hypothetical protein